MEGLFLLLFALVVRNTMAVTPLLDLSHSYNLDPPASHNIKILEKSMNRINIDVELNQMCSSEHAGTHLEAPITFSESGLSVDEIPFERLWRVPGVMIDVSPFVYPGYKITADVLQRWVARANFPIPDGGVLLIRTGFSHEAFLPNDEVEEDAPSPQPGLSEDAGEWLVNYRRRHGKGIFGVGIDLDSLDENDTNATTSVRAILYEGDIYALHNLKNLNLLPRSGFLLTVMPMKIRRGTGAPARVMAEKEDTRPTQPYMGSHANKSERDYWHSERDYIYPNPKWDPDFLARASADSSKCGILKMVIPLLTVFYCWLNVLV